MFFIGGRGCVLCQIIEPVTFARLYLHCGISHWADIYIHVETFKNIYGMTVDLIYIDIYIVKFRIIEHTRKLALLAIIIIL